jgi:hypothetical protein
MRFAAPWQVLVTLIFIYVVLYGLLCGAAAIGVWIRWPYTSGLLLLAAMFFQTFAVPASLNWTRASYKYLIPWQFLHLALTVLIYAGHYSRAGLMRTDGSRSHYYSDALYFSVVIWTTLGSGEFTAPPHLRLLTGLEAIMGALFLPFIAALFWQFLTEATAPPDEAFLDRPPRRPTPGLEVSPPAASEPKP